MTTGPQQDSESRKQFEEWFEAQRVASWVVLHNDPRKEAPAHWNMANHHPMWKAWQAARSLTERSEWQPISTRPSGPYGTYLVANASGQVAPWVNGVIHNNPGTANDWGYGESITHWSALPPPPLASSPSGKPGGEG